MDKKTMLKIFGEAFLRSMVVLMAIVIVGFVAFFVVKVTTDKNNEGQVAEESTFSDEELAQMSEEPTTEEITTEEITTEEVTTEEVTTEEEIILSSDAKILVLNTTNVSGLAKAWMEKLKSEDFKDVGTGNYSVTHDAQTKIIVKEEGMGQDLAQYFNNPVIEVGKIDSGVDVSTDGVEIFIVIGSNDTTVN